MIRRATSEDDVAELIRELGYEVTEDQARSRVARIVALPDHALFVADIDGDVAGLTHVCVASGIEYDPRVELRALVVAEKHRGVHVGEELIAAGEEWTRSHGLSVVLVRSNVVRTSARKFYERLGYVVTKTTNVFQKRIG